MIAPKTYYKIYIMSAYMQLYLEASILLRFQEFAHASQALCHRLWPRHDCKKNQKCLNWALDSEQKKVLASNISSKSTQVFGPWRDQQLLAVVICGVFHISSVMPTASQNIMWRATQIYNGRNMCQRLASHMHVMERVHGNTNMAVATVRSMWNPTCPYYSHGQTCRDKCCNKWW